MEPETFHSTGEQRADQAFRAWQRRNRNGFFINEKPGKRGMLHRTECMHVGSGDVDDPRWRPTSTPKHCHTDHRALRDWARGKGIALEDCSTCKPPR